MLVMLLDPTFPLQLQQTIQIPQPAPGQQIRVMNADGQIVTLGSPQQLQQQQQQIQIVQQAPEQAQPEQQQHTVLGSPTGGSRQIRIMNADGSISELGGANIRVISGNQQQAQGKEKVCERRVISVFFLLLLLTFRTTRKVMRKSLYLIIACFTRFWK